MNDRIPIPRRSTGSGRWSLRPLVVVAAGALTTLSCSSTPARQSGPPVSRKAVPSNPWLSDYDRLRDHLTSAYANLEWSASHGADLPKIDREARRSLELAKNVDEARAAIKAFVEAFADPHLRVAAAPVEESRRAVSSMLPATEGCTALGYRSPRRRAVDWRSVPGFAQIPGETFVHGVLDVGTRHFGVLRIASFLPESYPDACVISWRAAPGECDDRCQAELRARVEATLTREVESALEAIRARSVDALLGTAAGTTGSMKSPLGYRRRRPRVRGWRSSDIHTTSARSRTSFERSKRSSRRRQNKRSGLASAHVEST
jgi:hypothetical protein